MNYPGIFKQKYQRLVGRDWIKRVEKEDLLVWIDLGLQSSQHGRLGGQSRARTAKRDKRERFVKHGQ